MSPHLLIRGLAALLLSALAACRATKPAELGPPLPFHVAMIPTEVIADGEAEASSMALALDPQTIAERLRRSLEARGFTRVTLLERPAGEQDSPTDEEWQEAACRQGADLLLRTQLEYRPKIRGDHNEKFWLNLPLFLLGGPFCWFIGDRTYEATATLQAEFFDAATIHGQALADWQLFPLPIQTGFAGTDLNLLNRADGPEDYVFSLLIPAGLLARESEEVADEVAGQVVDTLSAGLLQRIHDHRRGFDHNPALAQFGIESREARVTRGSDGRVTVRVPLVDPARAGRLRGTVIDASGSELGGGYLEGSGEDGRYEYVEEIEFPPDPGFVSVRLEDASAHVRSFTFKVP